MNENVAIEKIKRFEKMTLGYCFPHTNRDAELDAWLFDIHSSKFSSLDFACMKMNSIAMLAELYHQAFGFDSIGLDALGYMALRCYERIQANFNGFSKNTQIPVELRMPLMEGGRYARDKTNKCASIEKSLKWLEENIIQW